MEIKENVTLFICEHCRKKLFRKSAMTLHEIRCSSNPENINACSGCKHLQEKEESYTMEVRGDYYNEEEVKCKGFHCKKLNKDLFPRKVIYKGIIDKYPESFEGKKPMPNTIQGCEHFDLGFFD